MVLIVLFISSDLAVDFASTVIPQSHIFNSLFISGVQRQFSRYFNEFEELQLLGKGAFGAVIKVFRVSLASLEEAVVPSLSCST